MNYPFRGLVINEFESRSLYCASSELVPQPYNPLFDVPLPNGFGGQQTCSFLSGPAFTLAAFDVDCTDSAWAQLGYTCMFYAAFTFLAIRAISKIDHSLQAALPPPLFRDIGLRKRVREGEGKHQYEITVAAANDDIAEKKVFVTFEKLNYSVMAPGPMKADGSGGDVVEKKILNDLFGVVAPGSVRMLCVLNTTFGHSFWNIMRLNLNSCEIG